MALYSDGTILRQSDLCRWQQGVEQTIAAEGISLQPLLAQAELMVGFELEAILSGPGGDAPSVPFNELLDHVAVGDEIRSVAAETALVLVYEAAMGKQAHERYSKLREIHEARARQAWIIIRRCGVALVDEPVRAPGKLRMETTSGDGLGGTFYARATWVSQDSVESAGGEITAGQCADGQALLVTSPEAERPGGWHLYAGTTATALTRQTVTPNEPGSSWTLNAVNLIDGVPLGDGQVGDRRWRREQRWRRG